MLKLLKRASEKNSSQPLGVQRAAIVNMSSHYGSIELTDAGGLYPYRCSKVKSILDEYLINNNNNCIGRLLSIWPRER